MTWLASVGSVTAAPQLGEHTRPAGGLAFDLAATLVCGWLLGGAYLDAWAHTHVANLETFFTPWHAVLYAGFLAVAVFHGGAWALAVRRGRPWRRALPPGYGLSLAAAAGLAADALAHWLTPSVRRLRLFAFAAPALVYVFYFLTLALTGGIGWTVHFWLGSTVLAGTVGLLLSYLLVPPALPAPERA